MDIGSMDLTPSWMKPVEHHDLLKKGVDETKHPKKHIPKKEKNNATIRPLDLDANIPEISSAESEEYITIIDDNTDSRIQVDRVTGLKIKSYEKLYDVFQYIYQFDTKTFPKNRDEALLSEVGFWNTQKKYIAPIIHTKKPTQFKSRKNELIFRLLCQELKKIRINKQISIEDLATSTGFTIHYIADLEAGKKNFTICNYLKICEGLNSDPSEILKMAEEKIK